MHNIGLDPLINPLIRRCEKLKMLSKNSLMVYYYYVQYNDGKSAINFLINT